MKDSTWLLILGVLIGVPIGVGIYWFLTHQVTHSATYSNVEEWEIIKDERGRTVGVKVHRTAKES